MATSYVRHHSHLCKEFILQQSGFQFKRWFLLSAILNSIGFSLNIHQQDSTIMTGVLAYLVLMLLLKIYFKVKQESILVISSLGIQCTTTFLTGRTKSVFIDFKHVHDIVILEAVSMHKVIYYLSVLSKEKDYSSKTAIKICRLFKKSSPRLQCLEEIYQGIQSVLWPLEKIKTAQSR